jgi:hypothetical protein
MGPFDPMATTFKLSLQRGRRPHLRNTQEIDFSAKNLILDSLQE